MFKYSCDTVLKRIKMILMRIVECNDFGDVKAIWLDLVIEKNHIFMEFSGDGKNQEIRQIRLVMNYYM